LAISFVGAAASTAGAVTIATSTSAVTLPSGLASGDLLIIAVHRTHDYPLTSATPTGYTFLRNIIDAGTTPNAAQSDIYYKVCTGSEGTSGPTFTTATATRWVVHAAAYRGASTTTPLTAESGQGHTTPSSTTHDAPTITNSNSAGWAVYAGGARGTASPVSWTPPIGMTERLDTDLAVANTSNVWATWADSAGTVATGSATYSGTTSGATPTATAWAAFINPQPVFGPPTGLTANPVSSTEIDLSWDAAYTATGYDVERDGVLVATNVATTSYSDTSLTPNTLYSYRVRSVQ